MSQVYQCDECKSYNPRPGYLWRSVQLMNAIDTFDQDSREFHFCSPRYISNFYKVPSSLEPYLPLWNPNDRI